MYYLNYFFIFSIIGHFIETVFTKMESGILYGYWTPVYGLGVVLILIVNKEIDKLNLKNKKLFKIFITYIICMVLLTFIELTGGYLIKWIWNTELWNYENYKFNIGKYISLEVANYWGVASIMVIYLIKPIMDRFIRYIPKIVTYILTFLFILDLVLTLILK